MNRFVALTVLVVAALALAAQSNPVPEENEEAVTQLSLVTKDDEETSEVNAKNLGVFGDFCIQSRDDVLADLKRKTDNTASETFTSFFGIVKEIAKKSLDTQDAVSERLATQLANPSTEVEGDDETAEYQRKVAQSQQPAGLYQAFVGVASSVSQTFIRAAAEKAYDLKKRLLNTTVYKDAARTACGYAKEYEEEMRAKFDQYKEDNLASANAEPFRHMTFDEVPCITAARIRRLNLFCRLFEQSGETLFKLFGRSQSRQVGQVEPQVDV